MPIEVHGKTKEDTWRTFRKRYRSFVRWLDKNDLLFLVVEKFNNLNLDPYKKNQDGFIEMSMGQPIDNVTNMEMGYIYEELIRKFSEQSNKITGEHFTPKNRV